MTANRPDETSRFVDALGSHLAVAPSESTAAGHIAAASAQARTSRLARRRSHLHMVLLTFVMAALVSTSSVAVAGRLPHPVQSMAADAARLMPVPIPIPYPPTTTPKLGVPPTGVSTPEEYASAADPAPEPADVTAESEKTPSSADDSVAGHEARDRVENGDGEEGHEWGDHERDDREEERDDEGDADRRDDRDRHDEASDPEKDGRHDAGERRDRRDEPDDRRDDDREERGHEGWDDRDDDEDRQGDDREDHEDHQQDRGDRDRG